MKTEQDIKKFMQENRIPVPKDDAFMADLVRQINLLPEPAGFSCEEDRIQENLRMLKAVLDSLKRHSRRQAAMLMLVNMVLSLAVFTAGHFLLAPEMTSYILMGFVCLAILAVTVSFTDLVRI